MRGRMTSNQFSAPTNTQNTRIGCRVDGFDGLFTAPGGRVHLSAEMAILSGTATLHDRASKI